RLRFAQECTDCAGTGKRRAPCALCHGKGTVPKTETVKVRIPAGVDTGSRVRIPANGEGGRLGAPAGDLFIITNVGRHQYFTRKGDNIYVTIPLTVPEAALGAKIEVPTVTGKAQLRIPPGTQSGQRFRLRERGAPSLRNPQARGDQFVEVQVTLPKVISEETKDLLRRYAQMNPENPRVTMGPSRSEGNTRLYTDADLERLELILSLTRDLGVNLAGVEIILNMREKMDAMQREFERFFSYLQAHAEEFTHFTDAPPPESGALVPASRVATLLRRRTTQRS
ncbi:MAG: MerR family transcriptional regulator, partial [Acidobacteria bacterium]|nr:MerR family transcriptional regulator [Acidobacteriota bacterium]